MKAKYDKQRGKQEAKNDRWITKTDEEKDSKLKYESETKSNFISHSFYKNKGTITKKKKKKIKTVEKKEKTRSEYSFGRLELVRKEFVPKGSYFSFVLLLVEFFPARFDFRLRPRYLPLGFRGCVRTETKIFQNLPPLVRNSMHSFEAFLYHELRCLIEI